MRKLLVLMVLLVPGLVRADDTRVASYYLNNPDKYEGQKITLNCSYVTRQTRPSKDSDNEVVFDATTASKNNFTLSTSSIMVHVPADVVEKFAHKYGSESKYDYNFNYTTRPMSGIFKKGNSGYYLDYTPNT